ncbi:uncharacterized protein LOC106061121 [Biomphalaria glabrata]|uniref:Uncharacterized protein LOC106061121 n=1 Tax=Biomphalaria glabrata TaxID=6526 RepID=A0A9U8E6I0_BIOGL|nr:uncharacterized protein LOC106061121 [Biomphalaria glabrata]
MEKELKSLAHSYMVTTSQERPNLDECCDVETILDRLNLTLPGDLISFHGALTDVASLINDVTFLRLNLKLDRTIIQTINITLCQLHRYFQHNEYIRPTRSFSSCKRPSNLIQCRPTTLNSDDCKAKITIDFIRSASLLLDNTYSGLNKFKNATNSKRNKGGAKKTKMGKNKGPTKQTQKQEKNKTKKAKPNRKNIAQTSVSP